MRLVVGVSFVVFLPLSGVDTLELEDRLVTGDWGGGRVAASLSLTPPLALGSQALPIDGQRRATPEAGGKVPGQAETSRCSRGGGLQDTTRQPQKSKGKNVQGRLNQRSKTHGRGSR